MTGPSPSGGVDVHLLAVAMLRRIEVVLRFPRQPEDVIAEPLFDGSVVVLGSQVLDSLDVIEALVVLQKEIGIHLMDKQDLAEAGTLLGLARMARSHADRDAVDSFCRRWADTGDYRP